jgi:diguanylate cyclase (GGDEF)-like protein/PAS domain S-box-containing protein
MNNQQPIRVLIAEDDYLISESTVALLRDMGYAIAGQALDGREAVEMTQSLRPDVILMDIIMPVMDGIEAAQRIYETCPTPVVALTAYDTPQVAERAIAAGMGAYLTKPANAQEIERAINVTIARFDDMMELRRLNAKLQADITERKRVEDALRESEKKYRTILENIKEGYYEVDLAGNFTFFNDSLCRFLGYPEDELMGMNNRQYMDAEAVKRVYQIFNAVYRTGKPTEVFDWEVIRKDGSRRCVEGSVSLMRDPTGEPTGFRGIVHDITERKRVEEALAHERDLLQALMDNIPDTIYFKDTASRFTKINKAQAQVLGVDDPQEVIGKTDFDFFTLGHAQDAYEDEQEIVKSGQPLIGKVERIRRADGQFRWVSATKVPMLDKEGRVIGTVGVSRDITEQVRTEEALGRQAAQLAALNRIGRHVASILDQQELVQQAVDAVRDDLGYPRAAVLLMDGEASELYVAAATDKFWEVIPDGYRQPVGKGAIGIAAETRETVLVEEASSDSRVYRVGEWFFPSSLSVPIKIGGRVTGVLEVEADVPNAFDENDQAALETMADQIAIALENANLYADIEQRQMYLEGVLNAAPDAIITLDAHHRIVKWNKGAERLFGYSREETIGQDLDHLVSNPDVFEEAVGYTQRVTSGEELPPTEAVRYRKDGSPVDVLLAGSPILVGDELIGVVAVYTDITERVRMEEALRALALLDELTGLYNRRGFSILAEHQLKMAERGKRRMLLLFSDLDGLKWINDTFGHPEGDRALIEVADILEETFRESDIVARIGGDEFVVLAVETNGSPAGVLTTRLRENLEARNAGADRRYQLSLSVGVAHYDPTRPCSLDDLLAGADRAMYGQKRCSEKS